MDKNNLNKKGFIVSVLIGIFMLIFLGGGIYLYKTKEVPTPVHNEEIEIPIVNTNIDELIIDEKGNFPDEQKEASIPKNDPDVSSTEIKKPVDNEAKMVTITQRDPAREEIFKDLNITNSNISTDNLKKYENEKYSFYVPNESLVRLPSSNKASNPLVGCNITAVNVDSSENVVGIVFVYLKICHQLIFQYVGNIDAYAENYGYIISGSFNMDPEKNSEELLKFKKLFTNIRSTFSLNKDMQPISIILGNYSLTTRKCEDSVVDEVVRYVPKNINSARAAVEELLKEPSLTERTAYFWTGFNKSFTLKSFDLKDGVATVDLSTSLNIKSNAWDQGICGQRMAYNQIHETLHRFYDVETVIYKINGEETGFPITTYTSSSYN